MDVAICPNETLLWQQLLTVTGAALLKYEPQPAPLLVDGLPNQDPWYKGQSSDGPMPLRLMAVVPMVSLLFTTPRPSERGILGPSRRGVFSGCT
jgi:hypothetical protein